MNIFKKNRVNIVITNRHLRYADNNLKDYGEIELPEGTIVDGVVENKDVLQTAVTKLVRKHKWRRSKLFFTVPDDTVVIRELEVPASLTEEETLGYVNMQLGKSFYLPFSNPTIAIQLLDLKKDKQAVLVYAYPKDQIDDFQVIFEEAGLEPVAADLTGLSVYRYYYQHQHPSDSHVLLLHWNVDALVITAFNQNKAVFSRYIKYTERLGKAFNELEINEVKALDLIEDLLIEINRILDFYHYSIMEGESPITDLLISGDFAYLEQVKERMAETVAIPIKNFREDDKSLELPLKYIDILGLALKKEG